MKEKINIKRYLLFGLVSILLVVTIFVFKERIQDNQLIKYAFHKKVDKEDAKAVLANTMFFVEVIKDYYEAQDEIGRRLNAIHKSILIPNGTWKEQKDVAYFRIRKMCDLHLQFKDIHEQFADIKSKNPDIGIEKLIYLSQLLSDYCNESAKAEDLWLNRKTYDSFLLQQLLASIRKEVSTFGYVVREIVIKFKSFVTEKEKEGFKANIEEKFKKEIEKYWDEYSKVDDFDKICMYPHEWPIVNLYMYT